MLTDRYAHIPEEDIPLSECLKDTIDRTLPYWENEITPALKRGKTVLVAAHGNSIRGVLKYLDGISDETIAGLEIPTGLPLVYQLDKDLQVMKVRVRVHMHTYVQVIPSNVYTYIPRGIHVYVHI